MTPCIGFLLACLVAQASPQRFEATRDLWVSNVGPEAEGNNGGAPRLKLKSIQEFSLIDFDLTPLKGRIVKKAILHLRSAGEPRLHRVTVGSVAADWVEGTGSNYEKQAGCSSFRWKISPGLPWTADGGDLCRVILGNGGSLWGMAEASPPDKDGWQAIAVDPRVIAARVAGISRGFVLFDDTGTEWKREGETFRSFHFPNRFVYGRDSNRSSAPYLTVEAGAADRDPPDPPSDLLVDAADLPSGEAWASWISPPDRGAAGVIGFDVKVGGEDVPRDQIPRHVKSGDRVRMKVRDPGREDANGPSVAVRAVDGAGNVGRWTGKPLRASNRVARPLPAAPMPAVARPSELPRIGRATVAVIDELDKLPPAGGPPIPPRPAGHLAANALWDASTRQIRLHAARNEFVAFQVVLQGAVEGLEARCEFDAAAGKPTVEIGLYANVKTPKGPMPDPIVPLRKPINLPEAGMKSSSLHAEIYVPHDASPGRHRGKLVLTAKDGQPLTLPIDLRVWDFTLPDSLSFLPEMNCYGLPGDERDYYRLAHKHRVVLNRLPYSQDGRVHDGCAPRWDGKTLDWSAWDARFGPLLDGSAFADLPRKSVPVEGFYLPIHENWPTPIDANYNGDYWADRAFTGKYRGDFVEVSRQFAAHFHAKKWSDTLFHAFLNNKVDFKQKGWSRGSSPWLLDEPANFQDFWALRYFGAAFHEGFNAAGPGPAKLLFRCDLSRPQWQRDSLDGLLDLNIVGGAMRTYRPIVMDRKADQGQVVIEYGTTNAVEDSNTQPVAWSLDVWTLGADGVLPWQTVGNAESWRKGDELSLFYPARDGEGPIPSVRLKAYRRGQQDVEYLTLWSQATKEPRWAVAARVREALALDAQRKTSGGEDAGRMLYDRLNPDDVTALRLRLGEGLSKLHPAARRKLVDFRTPRRDPLKLESKLIP